MKHFTSISLGLILGATVLSSCVKEKDFPDEPVIEFKEYLSYGPDSADCIIKFKDGDGDIGLLAGDSIADLRFKYFYKDTLSGQFLAYDYSIADTTFDTLFYEYRCPNLTPDGQYKALDGEIKAKLRAAPLYGLGHTVVKFEITLRDRAGHVSNMVSTNEIVVP
jgi:hypothetical protein